jgi:hypothetical protein
MKKLKLWYKIINFFWLIFIILFASIQLCFSELNLVSSPIKYELKAVPWEKITKTAKFISREENSLFITTWKSNVTIDSESGNPILVDKWNPNQELASWITIDTDNFTIDPFWSYTINFDINIPENATPWWHYWVVLFKYDPLLNNWYSSDNTVNIGAQYWILILLEVDWEIIDKWRAENIAIIPKEWWWNWWWTSWLYQVDDCPYWDFSPSNIDGKCLDEINPDNLLDYIKDKWKNKEDLELTAAEEDDENDFEIDFSVPFQNDWNTHIKPDWKITLVDEDWNPIEKVWVENILDKNWVIIWENIVDYIPINQENSNVLPNTQKTFVQKWKWFPYKVLDENWNIIIKYWIPSDYYSSKNKKNINILYPWQREYLKLEQKKISAITVLSYSNYNWELIEFNSAKDFYVEYETKHIWYDPFFFTVVIICILILWFVLSIVKRVTKKKCINCKKWIKKKLQICPYCWVKQEKKEIKKTSKVRIRDKTTKTNSIQHTTIKSKTKK